MANKRIFAMSSKSMKLLLLLCRLVLGGVFLFSGLVKCVDPYGFAYKLTDYFHAFDIAFFDSLAMFISFVWSALEFWLGIAILIGIKNKFAVAFQWIFLLFMTPFTLYLAMANPISDCGCFGDAVVLTNWQTFYKNVLLLSFSSILFYYRTELKSLFNRHTQHFVSIYVYLFALSVAGISYYYLPIFDFRPYKIGTNIAEGMEFPEGAEPDRYENTFIYEKNGVQKRFTLNDYPADDSTWHFVSSEVKLVKKGYIPPIHDFVLTSLSGEDRTDAILADTSYTFLLVAPRLETANDEFADRINEIHDYCINYNYGFYCVTSSPQAVLEEWSADTGGDYPYLLADEITLKTIIRSNPGLVLLKNGVIINKWPDTFLPDIHMLDRPLDRTSLGELLVTKQKTKVLFFVFMFAFPLMLLFVIEKMLIKIMEWRRWRKNAAGQTNDGVEEKENNDECNE